MFDRMAMLTFQGVRMTSNITTTTTATTTSSPVHAELQLSSSWDLLHKKKTKKLLVVEKLVLITK